MSEKITWLITGCSRGIGLELTRQLLTNSSTTVVATCRNPESATDLHALKTSAQGTLHIARIDVADEASIRGSVTVVEELLGENATIDYIYNNAAINETNDTAFNFDSARLMRCVQANVVGPAVIAQVYLPFLERGAKKTIVNVSTGLASIGIDCGVKCATYSMSKAMVNMLTYKQMKERPDITSVVIDPGWVKTVMGGEGAVLEVDFAVSHILKLVTSLTIQDSGKFFRYDRSIIPW